MRSIEICAGAGGQALGLEQAGFEHVALVEIDKQACETLLKNRPHWNVIVGDLKFFSAKKYRDIDLLAGGVPCPPFSVAGKQLGHEDERDLFPEALRLVGECSPKAVMLENVRGLFDPKFAPYRERIMSELGAMGYQCRWELVNANSYGVSQSRSRTLLVALKKDYAPYFAWPSKAAQHPLTVGQLLYKEMASRGWEGAKDWAEEANSIAPTLVGGSKKHGGADLGPVRARAAWERLGVNGKGLADDAPEKGFTGMPKLTVKMAALVQGFPSEWEFAGKKTSAYRQVGNAFPPPVARAVSGAIRRALLQRDLCRQSQDYREVAI
ncbi:MAG: DNA cytosine methyltransferase [Eggerthellaceae bacterium]|nr:DNA cytosine methyltransferase [Eggerthellaceae bacterium]MDR2715964.1 DNA cytosine methyltransferase [Coriobacteriaceae bacterium]